MKCQTAAMIKRLPRLTFILFFFVVEVYSMALEVPLQRSCRSVTTPAQMVHHFAAFIAAHLPFQDVGWFTPLESEVLPYR